MNRALLSKLTLCVALLSGAFALPSCNDDSDQPQLGTFTNWLRACDANAECGDELSCLCGVCTVNCSTNNGCGDYDGQATCVEPSGASLCEAPVATVCDVNCASNSDCDYLGEGVCVSGRCRALSIPDEEEILRMDEVLCAARTDRLRECDELSDSEAQSTEETCLEEVPEVRLVRQRYADSLYECIEQLPCESIPDEAEDCIIDAFASVPEDVSPVDIQACKDLEEDCITHLESSDFNSENLTADCLVSWQECRGEPSADEFESSVCLSLASLPELQRESAESCFDKACDTRLDCLLGLGAFLL